jgi:hypothetical protein
MMEIEEIGRLQILHMPWLPCSECQFQWNFPIHAQGGWKYHHLLHNFFLSLLQNHKRMKGFSLLPDLQLPANWSLLVILAHPVSLKAEKLSESLPDICYVMIKHKR